LVVAVEMFSAVVHPFPEDFGGTTEEVCRHVERYPPWVLAVVVPMWAAAAFAGVWIAGKLGNLFSSTIVGLLLLAALVFNLSMLPYPLWFKISNLLAVPAAVLIGVEPSLREPPGGPAAGGAVVGLLVPQDQPCRPQVRRLDRAPHANWLRDIPGREGIGSRRYSFDSFGRAVGGCPSSQRISSARCWRWGSSVSTATMILPCVIAWS